MDFWITLLCPSMMFSFRNVDSVYFSVNDILSMYFQVTSIRLVLAILVFYGSVLYVTMESVSVFNDHHFGPFGYTMVYPNVAV